MLAHGAQSVFRSPQTLSQDMTALKDGQFDFALTSLGINMPPKSDVVLQGMCMMRL